MSRIQEYWLWPIVVMLGGLILFGMPGGYGDAATSLLHGLCAQTPSHSFEFGTQRLPFDGRMTGIYPGCLIVLVQHLGTGKRLRYGNPGPLVVAILATLVGMMAIDGLNSLLKDIGMWHPYAPSNVGRLVTGFGSGVALGTATVWLVAGSLWKFNCPDPITNARDLVLPFALLVPYATIVLSGIADIFPFMVTLLVSSAWITVSALALVCIVLSLRWEERIDSVRKLHVPVAIAAFLGLTMMLGLAGARFWFEHYFGISHAMM